MKHKTWSELLQSADGDAHRVSIFANLQDRQYKEKFLHTLYLCIASFACGFVACQRGPSILDLGLISGANLQSTAAFFSLGAGGYVGGCLLAGLTLDRFYRQMFLFWATVGLCASTAVLPWCVPYSAMAAFYFIGFIFIGSLETGSYATVARLWGRQGGEVLKVLQLSYIIGGIISPAVTPLFLVPRPITYDIINRRFNANVSYGFYDTNQTQPTVQSIAFQNQSETTITLNEFWGYYDIVAENSETKLDGNHSEKEHIQSSQDTTPGRLNVAYAISAGVCLLASAPFLASYVKTSKPKLRGQMSTPSNTASEHKRDQYSAENCHRRWVLLVVVAFFFLVTAVEESFHQFLFTVIVCQARWTELWAALLTAWFWCGVAAVRIAALFSPRAISDETLLVSSCGSLICVLAALHASIAFSANPGVWVCVLLTGMSASLVTPLSFSWLHSTLMQTSSAASVSAVVMVASSLAGVLNPLMMGRLLQHRSLDWFTYLLLLEAGLALLLLFLLVLVSRTLLTSWQRVATHVTEEEVTVEKTEVTQNLDTHSEKV